MTFSGEPAADGTEGGATSPSLRSRAPRATTLLLVARVTGERHDTLCRISNISTGGLRAEGPDGAFAVGEAVVIEVRHAHRLTGQVVWVDGGAFGLRFDAKIDVEAFLTALASTDVSLDGLYVRAPRLPTQCKVEIRLWGRIHRPVMTDLSQRGACFVLGKAVIEPETPLTITIAGLASLRAVARWVQDGQCGIAFLETLPLARLSQWLMDPALRYSAGS